MNEALHYLEHDESFAVQLRLVELYSQVESAPDDEALWTSLQEFLARHGDARAEWSSADALRQRELQEVGFGSLAHAFANIEVKHGFVISVTLKRDGIDPGVLTQAAAHPVFRLCRHVWMWDDKQGVAHLACLPSLAKLEIDQILGSALPPLEPLVRLTSLDIGCCRDLEDLGGLMDVPSLVSLSLRENDKLDDLRPLGSLVALESVYIDWYTKLRDISPLRSLPKLRNLSLFGSEALRDIEPLAAMTNLAFLYLGRCKRLEDFRPLASLRELSHLVIDGSSHLRDISFLTSMPGLRELGLRFCRELTDIGPISQLEQLEQLDLGYSYEIEDFSPLSKLEELVQVEIGGTVLARSMPALASLPALTTLRINTCGDLAPLRDLARSPHLRTLSLGGVYKTDVSPVSALTQLTSLELDDFDSDIQQIVGLTELSSLTLKLSNPCDVQPLAQMKWLRKLKIKSSCEPIGLAALAELTELEEFELDLFPRRRPDFSLVASLERVTRLVLGSHEQVDITELSRLRCLRYLDVSRCKFDPEQVREFIARSQAPLEVALFDKED